MFLKRLKLTNYRKFSSEKNIVEFISSKIVLNQDNDDINDNFEENSVQNDCDEIDVASDTTLIIGKNNAGKTTIITALDNLINHNNAFGANDFNYKSSPNLCVHSSSSYVSPSMLPLSSGDLIEWSLVCHSTLSYQKFCDRHSNHYDHPEELHQSVE